MRYPLQSRLAVIAIVATLLAASAGPDRHALAAAARRPVLVELFTSEGCSSCPPADALLARLDSEQFVSGAQAIVLSEHVTYWNQQGWRDPFSSETFTDRQHDYGTRFSLDSVYTPQAVIDGAAQIVGSDEAGMRRAIAQAASSPGIEIAIEGAQWSGGAIHFKVRVTGSPAQEASAHGANLVAAIAEDSAQSSVSRGENAGRTLRHVAVVRSLENFGKDAFDGRQLAMKASAAQGASMRLVVFLADRRTGHIEGVTEQTISR
jgi:hypothetical protein